MTATMQRELFNAEPLSTKPAIGLFADVVFDRPLDHAFSYAVPDDLRASIAVGKRVLAPFGRGDQRDHRLLRPVDRNRAGACRQGAEPRRR